MLFKNLIIVIKKSLKSVPKIEKSFFFTYLAIHLVIEIQHMRHISIIWYTCLPPTHKNKSF